MWKASATVLMLMGIAHLFGHFQGLSRLADPVEERDRVLASTMRAYEFVDAAGTHSVLDLYLGFSLTMSALALTVGAMMWLAASSPQARRVGTVYVAGLAIMTAVSARYFILPPTVFLLVALGLGLAAVARKA